jgi:hypothetical protein
VAIGSGEVDVQTPELQVPGVQVFGVRHHGPGSARALVAALEAYQPHIVLIELPADTANVLPLALREDMVPPVALLGYVRDEPERAAFWPLADFSPEWCAVRWAGQRGVPVEPIDLPISHMLAAGGRSHIGRDPIAELAAAAGDSDPERWWDDVVEHRGDGDSALVAVGEAMAAVRGATSAAECVAAETVLVEGTDVLHGPVVSESDARREAHMRRAIRRAMTQHARVAVICGAWHVPALTLPFPPASLDTARLRGAPRVPVTCTWVPWTHRRLAAGTGYGAGVRSPGWYAHVHTYPGEAGLVRWFALAGATLRSTGRRASPDHLIAGVRLADALAALRGRPRAGLDEVLDSSVAVLGDGHDTVLSILRERLVVGEGIGAVPSDTPMVPLARDLAARQRRCRLTPTAERRVLDLDLRTAGGLARSRLLHQLVSLHIPWGVLTDGRGSTGSFRETWELRWEPEYSVLVVERSGDGTTVEAAAVTRLLDDGQRTDSVLGLVALVEQALLADLPDAVDPLVQRLSNVTAASPDLSDVMDALTPLARTVRYGDVRGSGSSGLSSLFHSLTIRVVAGLDRACRFLDDDMSRAMAERLTAVQAALGLVDHDARHDLWPRALERLVTPGAPPLLAGRAARLMHDSGHWQSDRSAHTLAMWLGRGTPVSAGAGFVEGMFGEGGTLLIHDHVLVDLLDRWIASLDADSFSTMVVLLRRTFSVFEPAERRRIGEIISGTLRHDATQPTGDWDAELAARALRTLRHLWGINP